MLSKSAIAGMRVLLRQYPAVKNAVIQTLPGGKPPPPLPPGGVEEPMSVPGFNETPSLDLEIEGISTETVVDPHVENLIESSTNLIESFELYDIDDLSMP